MSGPALKLSVTGAGVATIDGLNQALERLRTNLGAIKTAKPDLGSVDALTSEFKRFRNEFVEIAQAQKTAFIELAETLRAGFGKAAAVARAGAAELDKALSRSGVDANSGIPSFKAKLMVGSAAIVEAAEVSGNKERNAMFGWKAKLQVGSLAIREGQELAAERAASGAFAWQAKLQVGSLKIAENIAAASAAEDAAKFGWTAKMQLGSLKIAEQQALSAEKAASGALAWQAKLQVGSLKIAENIAAASAAEDAAKFGWTAKMQLGSLKIAEQQALSAEKAASGALAWQAKLQVGSLKIAEEIEAAAEREAKARRDWIIKMQVGSAQIAAEQLAAAQREIDGALRAEAAYAARSPKQQLNTQVRARAQLDVGREVEDVTAAFGPTAAAAAQAAESLDALKSAHQRAGGAAGEHEIHMRKLSDTFRDGHAAARGLASQLDAMFLTYGRLGPLLAGAALGGAFVQTVKVGADVAHELAIVQVLGEESAHSVRELNEQLIILAQNGPFGPREIAAAFKQLELAGISVKDQKAAIGDVLNFAVAGTTTIEQAATSLVQIGTAFGYTANGFGRVGDVISKAAAISMSSVESLTRSMQAGSEVHILYGQSLVDVATNLSVLSQLGIRGTAGGTALKNMYAELSGSTATVRKNMLAWHVDVLDPQTGKVKNLTTLVALLADKYNSLKGPDQTRFIQDLSNTRGGKDMVAVITAFNTQVQDMSAKDKAAFRSQLLDMQQKIAESYGFQALAGAQLALTAKNQMATVGSSLQAALASAFQGLEPALLKVTSALQGIFKSDAFQANVQNLAVAVGNFTVMLVSNLNVIKNLAIAYAAWKTGMIAGSVIEATIGGLGRLRLGYEGVRAATAASALATEANALANGSAALKLDANTAAKSANAAASGSVAAADSAVALRAEASAVAKTAETVAVEANTVAQRGNALATESAAAVGSAAAAKGLGRIAGMLPVIGTVITAGIIAWDLYWAAASGKKDKAADDAVTRHQAVLDRLKAEVVRTREQWLALSGLKDQADFNQSISAGKQELQSLQSDLEVKQYELEAAKIKVAKLQQVYAGELKQGGPDQGRNYALGTASNDLQAARKQEEAAQKEYDKIFQIKRETTRQLEDSLKYSEGIAKLADAQANKPQPQGSGSAPVVTQPTARASALREQFTAEKRTLEEQYKFEQDLLNAEHKEKLLSDEAYAIRSEGLASRQYDAELALLTDYVTKYQAIAGELRAANKGPKVDADLKSMDEMLARLDLELKHRQQIAKVKRDGQINLDTRAADLELTKLKEGVDLQEKQLETKLAIDKLLPEQQAYMVARNAEEEKYTNLILKTQQAISDLTRDISNASDNDPDVVRLRARLIDLEAELARIRKAQADQSARAGEIATRSVVPQWKKDAEEWGNTVRLMQKAYDDMVTGIVQKGQEMWLKFVQTGKLSGRDMLNFIRDQLATTLYQQQIAPFFRDLGQKVAAAAYGQRPGYQKGDIIPVHVVGGASSLNNDLGLGNSNSSAAEDLIRNPDIAKTTGDFARYEHQQENQQGDVAAAGEVKSAFKDVSDAASPLITRLKDFGQGLWDSISAVGRWVQGLLSMGGGGGGGLGGLSSLFGGGGAGAAAGSDAGVLAMFSPAHNGAVLDSGMSSYALGGVFGDIQRFARGDVFNRPTMFQYAQGGGFGLGELGEAGPEAVMPLKRGPGGSLGVVAHGGGSAPTVNITIENHGAEVTQTEEKKSNGDRDIKLIVRAAVHEVNKQISSGGSVATTLRASGVPMTGRLPRRS